MEQTSSVFERKLMADTQSQLSRNGAATERTQTDFLRSLISFFKNNRDFLPDLPEMIECLIANEGDVQNKMNAACHVSSEGNRTSTEKGSVPEDNAEAAKTETRLMEEKEKERFLSRIQLIEAELEEKRREVLEKDKKMSEMKKDIEKKLAEKEVEMQDLRDKYSTSYEKLKTRNDALKKAIQEKDETISLHSQRIQSLRDELKQRKEVILNMEEQHSQRLSKMTDELKASLSKLDGYKSRLASLSEKRVKQDQRLVEDTLSSNRQSELERDFSDFFDNERMDACEVMQTIYQNKEEDFLYIFYPRLACIILESAYEIAKQVNKAAIDLFMELTENMVKNAAQMGQNFSITRKLFMEKKYHHDVCTVPITVALWRKTSDYPKDTIDGLTLALKETADVCNVDSVLIHEVVYLAFDKWIKWMEEDNTCLFTPAWHLLERLAGYINASIRLAWRMVTQVPPMKLEYNIMKYDKRIHKKISLKRNVKDRPRTRSSAQQDQDEEVTCYLWPGLQDGAGRQTRLGEVLCLV